MQRLLGFVTDNGPIFQLIGFVGLLIGLTFIILNHRKSRRGLGKAEEAVNAFARQAAGATLGLANASVDALGGFAGAIEALVKTTQSLTDIITAMAICWDQVMMLMAEGRYHDAAKMIASDPRIKTIVTTRNLIKTIYLMALRKAMGDAGMIKVEFPFVIEALEPFPDYALPLPPEGAPKNDAAGST